MRRFHYNRISSAISVGSSDNGIGKIDSVPTGNHFLPYGTVLSNACGSSNASDRGEVNTTYDALGTSWNGFYYNWKELANGTGGSFWQQTSPALAGTDGCWYPYGFVTTGYSNNPSFDWSYGNQSGTYIYANVWDVTYSDGNGGLLYSSGSYEFNGNGYELSPTGYFAEGKVVYVSFGSWSFWYNYGYSFGGGWQDVTADVGCGNFVIHSEQYEDHADGNGGTYRTYTGYWNNPSSGTILTNCNNYDYVADGNGNYYQGNYTGGNPCPNYGTLLDSGSGSNSVVVDCINVVVNSYGWNTYADGSCGTYGDSGGSQYYMYGQQLGQCGDTTYYSDGGNGYYSETPCPSYGTQLNSGGGDYTVNIEGNDYVVGSYGWTEYANGSCGTYTQGGGGYNGYGTFITETSYWDEMNQTQVYTDYYSDGYGGYYSTQHN